LPLPPVPSPPQPTNFLLCPIYDNSFKTLGGAGLRISLSTPINVSKTFFWKVASCSAYPEQNSSENRGNFTEYATFGINICPKRSCCMSVHCWFFHNSRYSLYWNFFYMYLISPWRFLESMYHLPSFL
jgi:hypothetical protein